jgi:PhzF family phenazine biosynthesis protein
VCRALKLGGDALQLELQAGMVPVRANGDRWTLTALNATWRECDASNDALAAALGLTSVDIGERPMWMKAGKEQLIVPLRSLDAVRRTKPEPRLMEGIKSEDGHSMAYVFAYDGPHKALSRFFFPSAGAILEDPATGSATANFGAWHLALQRGLPVSLRISQGSQVGRPSHLYLDVDAARQIFVGGDVVELGRGTLSI